MFGVILTILTLLVFTRSWRSTVIAGVVIPSSLIAGFLFMDFSGFSINGMTLAAVAASMGTLIFNAIVLIESSLQLMQKGMKPADAAILGTKQSTVALIAGASTNIIVFLPLAFMRGIMGIFMFQFGMTVIYLTLTALMFSFSLTPMMIAKFLRVPKEKAETKKVKKSEPLSWFRPVFDSQMKYPWRWILIGVGSLFMSGVLMGFVGSEFAPAVDTSEINIVARTPMGSTLENTIRMVDRVEERLAEFPEVDTITVRMGRRGLQNANLTIRLVPRNERASDREIAQRMVYALSDIPNAEFQIRAGEAGGGFSTSDMVVSVLGEEDAIRESLARELIDRINQIEEVQSAVFAEQDPADEIRFIPDTARMNQWGATNAAVGMAMRVAFYGDDTTFRFRERGREYPMILEFSRLYRNIDSLSDVLIETRRGMVPLSELGTVEIGPASRNIFRRDKHRQTEININLGKSTIGPVRALINAEIRAMDIPEGYRITFGGMTEMQDETTNEMARTFLLAAILTFVLLAAIVNSISRPFRIATSIITSFTGVFLLMFLVGATMNISAMMAMILLIGLSVNNDILLIEPTTKPILEGVPPAKALWDAYLSRYRTVIMTTIAVCAGLLPQMFLPDGNSVSMAAVLIGGLIGGLIYSFIFTPALFIIFEEFRERLPWRKFLDGCRKKLKAVKKQSIQ
jgi:HAE1 family hydrophobic/amphiphilic exporter-1